MQSSVGAGDLGRYRLDRLLGAGGMGEVYLAHDLVLPREVAIKFLSAADIDPDTLKRRLVHEAQAVAALDHPSICVVHDVGVDPTGRPFMVMQYVEGETLAARLARGPLPARDALRICAQIAEALGTAHKRGIVHRDLKPHNVMITPSGAPKLLDFGIAKALPGAESATVSADTASFDMQSHAFAGTPSYMSPEQVLQRPLDGRSDLFSLGCILYESLTGKRPFHGAQTVDVLAQILHAHPPAPSTVRGELDERHDELIRRLMAKEPADRFQSADELVGALRMLQPDTSRQTGEAARTLTSGKSRGTRVRRAAIAVAIALAVSVTGFAIWRWSHPNLPPAPLEAERYYQRGTDALRDGAYHSAESALTEAIRLFPQYPLAYARRAESYAEMDDNGAAAHDLVRVGELVPNKAQLGAEDRLRFEAIQFLVLGDTDRAVSAYAELASRRSDDAGAWVDLGRAQEAAAHVNDARASFERAIAIDSQYAAARLRLGVLDGIENRPKEALASLDEAQRLYRATSNKEGEAETLIRRGGVLDGAGDFASARESLLRARDIARVIGNQSQVVRADMQLTSVMVSQGQFAQAEQLASSATQSALDAGLDTAAADGLSKLAAVLSSAGKREQAEAQALDIAQRRGAERTIATVRTQLASVQAAAGRPADALQTLEPALAFFTKHKFRNLELTALAITARAYEALDDLGHAHAVATRALQEAEATGNEYHVSLLLPSLATQATALGAFPEALKLRERAEAIHREQKDASQLPYDLTGRADLLIKLGRFDDAAKALQEVDDGARAGLPAYVSRRSRVAFLRALSLTLADRLREARTIVAPLADPASDSAPPLALPILRFIDAREGRRPAEWTLPPLKDPAATRERQYWTAAAAVACGNEALALAEVQNGLDQARRLGNDELGWRLAAVGVAASRLMRQADTQQRMHGVAAEALQRLHAAWGSAAATYDERPDLVELRKAAGL